MRQREREFSEFYQLNRDVCLRAVLVCVGDKSLAEDSTAEAFARAWERWAKVREHPSPRAWVVRTALNANVSLWRRRRREVALGDFDRATGDGPAAPAEPRIQAALRQLPERQRAVVALRVFLDLDTKATAVALGIAPGTVTAHLARAMSTLRTELFTLSNNTRSN